MRIGKADRITAEMVCEKPVVTKVLEINEVPLKAKTGTKVFKQIQLITEDGVISDWDCYPFDVEVGDIIKCENPSNKGKMTVTVIEDI